MILRDALISQSPSLELQRAAANEIAHLDGLVKRLSLEPHAAQQDLKVARPWRDAVVARLIQRDLYDPDAHDLDPQQAVMDLLRKE